MGRREGEVSLPLCSDKFRANRSKLSLLIPSLQETHNYALCPRHLGLAGPQQY